MNTTSGRASMRGLVLAGILGGVLALLLFGLPIDMDPIFFRASFPAVKGLVLYLVGNYRGAAGAYREDFRQRVLSGDWQLADPAMAALVAGDLTTAEARARDAVRRDPRAVEARLTLAEVALLRGQERDALVLLEEVEHDAPDDVDTLLLAAVASARSGAPGPAIDRLNHALRLGGGEKRITVLLHAMEVTGELSGQPAATRPSCLLAHLHRYLRIYDAAEARPAIRLAKAAIARGDHPADAYLTLGVVYDKRGYPDDAMAAFQQAIALDPRHRDALHWAAVLYRRRGDLVREYQMRKQAYEAHPDDREASRDFGDLLIDRLGDIHQAKAVWEQALRERPESPYAMERLGQVEDFLGDRARAIELFQGALRLDPKSESAQARLGRTLIDAGRAEDAVTLFRGAVDRAPDEPLPHGNLAMAYSNLFRYPEAVQELERAMQLGLRQIPYVEHLCELYLYQTTSLDKAAGCFRWLLSVDPGNVRARRLLPEIQKNLQLRAGSR